MLNLKNTMIKRKKTKVIKIGSLKMGGKNPILVQSMTNTDTRDVNKTVAQIKQLEKVGCELVRIAVPDMQAAKSIAQIKKSINIPLVADIHFIADLALEAVAQGIDKLRINPGNIQSREKLKAMVEACKKKKIPMRIGINGGSIEKEILKKYKGKVTAEGMVESALKHIKILEKLNFKDMAISLKASDIDRTIRAYKILSDKVDYPLHLGVTHAGTKFRGTIVSSIGIGTLLYQGIGDTLRVSLTDNPIEEIPVAWEILKSLELRQRGPTIVSCPGCGRVEVDLVAVAKKVENLVKKFPHLPPINISVMGCVVNGPGEAQESDLAVVMGRKAGLIYKKGKIIKKVSDKEVLKELEKELIQITND